MKIRLKLWHKLALAITSIIVLVLVIAMILSQNSFRAGFLGYLNSLENQRIDTLERRLISDYQNAGSWDFLTEEYRSWGQYFRQSMLPNRQRRGRGRGKRGEFQPRQDFRKRPPPDHRRGEGRRRPPDRRNKKSGRPRAPLPSSNPLGDFASRGEADVKEGRRGATHISLYDQTHSLLAGIAQTKGEHIERPIKVNDTIVAYLYIQPFNKLTNKLDQGFVEEQTRSFVKIGLIALVLSLIAAWSLAYYFRQRINKLTTIAHELTSGNFEQKAQITHADELGQLGKDLNYLGRTLDKNRTARRQWIADISHELRTPLAILRGELEALEDGIRPLNKSSVQSLIVEVQRLVKLVEDLYQLSLSDLGSLDYVKETIEVSVFMTELVEHFQQRFTAESIKLSLHCNVDQSVTISGDERRLFQLFSNLLENSARYTDSGGELRIQCSANRETVQIKMEDSSPSVPDDQLPKLFDRLYRGDASRNSQSGGAGLGLSIVKAITEAHNGAITAGHSSLGGLAIILELPIHAR